MIWQLYAHPKRRLLQMNELVLSGETVREVTDPQVVPRLMNGWEMRYLAPFMGREATLSGAARELGVSLPRLHYQVNKLLGEGLLRLTRTERRAGHRVKLYRAVADAFFVPFDLMPREGVEEVMASADEPWRTFFLQSLARVWREHPGRWGMHIAREGDGGIRAGIVRRTEHGRKQAPWSLEDAEMPAVLLGGWVTDLALDFEDAKALQRELGAVVARYLNRHGAQRYLLQTRLAPLRAEGGAVPRVTVR